MHILLWWLRSRHQTILSHCILYNYSTLSTVQPDDGHYRKPKHVVPILSHLCYKYINSCVLTTLYTVLYFYVISYEYRRAWKEAERRREPVCFCTLHWQTVLCSNVVDFVGAVVLHGLAGQVEAYLNVRLCSLEHVSGEIFIGGCWSHV